MFGKNLISILEVEQRVGQTFDKAGSARRWR